MHRRSIIPVFLLFFLVCFAPGGALAQNPDEGPIEKQKFSSEYGFHLGRLLPNQISGVTEITPQWGLRMGFLTGGLGTVEIGAMTGKGYGAEWTNIELNLRMDIPVETLLGIAYVGLDTTRYKGVGLENKTFGGGHIGGGIMAHISEELWFRTDMKFNVNPGTSLYFGFGFLVRFPDGDAAGGAPQ